MRRIIFIGLGLFLPVFSLFASGPATAVSLEQYFVSNRGYDLNDGLTVATAFGSVTRVVAALDTLDNSGSTLKVQVILETGTYNTTALNLKYNSLAALEFYGDITGFWFGSTGEIQILNHDSNTQNYLLRIENGVTPIVFKTIYFYTLNTNMLQTMIDIQNSRDITFNHCKIVYMSTTISYTLQSLVKISGSQNVNFNQTRIGIDDNLGMVTNAVRNIWANNSSDVLFDHVIIDAWHPTGLPFPPPTPDVLVYLTQTNNAVFAGCDLYSHNDDAVVHGFELAPDSANTRIESCGVSRTTYAVLMDNCWTAGIQNNVLANSSVGIYADNARNCQISNNLIRNHWQTGVRLIDQCQDTVFFNNIVTNNGGSTGPQIAFSISDPAQIGESLAWQSGYNLILPNTGQLFAEHQPLPYATATPVPIHNLKQWIEQTGQDDFGGSICYPVAFATPELIEPNWGEESWGHGTVNFVGRPAAAKDYYNQLRPFSGETTADLGCIERLDAIGAYHHFALQPDTTVAGIGNTIAVKVEFRNSQNQQIADQPDYRLYFYLQNGSLPFNVESTGIIQSPDYALQAADSAGLYYVDANSFTAEVTSFRLEVARHDLDSREVTFRLRVIEWEDWDNTTSLAYGGRTDDASAQLRWISGASAQNSRITASTSPVLASGAVEDYFLLKITAQDSDGNPIGGLKFPDFVFKITGGKYDLDALTFAEDLFQPGTYQIELRSTEVGVRTIEVTVLETALPALQVIFQPGIYGVVTAQDTGQGLSDIRITLTAPDNTQVGATVTDAQGRYRIALSAVDTGTYQITAVDPSERYVRQKLHITIPSDTSGYQAMVMNNDRPGKIEAYGYPNPAQRGSAINIMYNVPRSGHCKLEVFDMRGRRLITLLDERIPAGPGTVVWDALNRFDKQPAPGTYVVVLRLDSDTQTWKLVIAP